MTTLGQVAKWSAIGLGTAGLIGAGTIALRGLLDDPADVPGVGSGGDTKPAGAPREHGLSRIGGIGAGISWLQAGANQALRGVFGDTNHREADGSTPLAQATELWRALHEQLAIRGLPGAYASRAGELRPTAVWGFGQNIAAAMDLAHVNGDWSAVNEMFERLPAYAHPGGGYAPDISISPDIRYWDDNAWIGLDLMQAYTATGDRSYLDRALELVPFIREGLVGADGGVLWEERSTAPSINTCTQGPTLELLLRLYKATGREDLLQLAHRLDGVLERQLRREDGLYIDHVNVENGHRGERLYSYNQGTPIGADVLWYRITGDESRLEHAKQTAHASLDWLATGDTLWKQPPVFNAIFFRNLMALDAVAPDPRYRAALEAYVDRGWREARNPETGLFTEGGVGAYTAGEPGAQIDQAGWVQMQALLAMPEGAARPDIA